MGWSGMVDCCYGPTKGPFRWLEEADRTGAGPSLRITTKVSTGVGKNVDWALSSKHVLLMESHVCVL